MATSSRGRVFDQRSRRPLPGRTVEANRVDWDAIKRLKVASVTEIVAPSDVIAKYTGPLTDVQAKLSILRPAVPLHASLEYPQKNPHALAKVRETLGLMARRIQAEPRSTDLAHEIETKTLPELIVQLADAAKARDAWLSTAKTKRWLKAAGLAVGAASAVLAVVTAPVTTVALAIAGLGIVSGSAIPGTEWLLHWRDGKKTIHENGLHYLLRV